MLDIVDVEHVYDNRDAPAVSDFTLHATAGSSTALVGPSGSGKSTILAIAALTLRPTAGEVCVGGHETASLSEAELTRLRRRNIGVLYQQPRLISHLTVAENILVPLLSDSRRASHRVAHDLLRGVDLPGYADRMPSELSGGQAQRVALCRALVRRPAMLIADEPTASLDGESAAAITNLLARQLTQGMALLVATHDSRLAAWASTVVELERGTQKVAAKGRS